MDVEKGMGLTGGAERGPPGVGAGLPGHVRIPLRGDAAGAVTGPALIGATIQRRAAMSAGLTASDSMFSVRAAPWHGLGAVLDRPPASVAEAIEAAGLGWVSSRSLSWSTVARAGSSMCCATRRSAATTPPCVRTPKTSWGSSGSATASCRTTRRSRSLTSSWGARSTSRRPGVCAVADAYGARDAPRAHRSRRRRCAALRAADEQPRRLDRCRRSNDADPRCSWRSADICCAGICLPTKAEVGCGRSGFVSHPAHELAFDPWVP
jgi:hypothetical protein